MPRPLALTLGEPAGIGPDITLAAWLRRAELALPPFYVLADPGFLDRLARPFGQRITADLFGERHTLDLPLVGEFQAMNVLAALGHA